MPREMHTERTSRSVCVTTCKHDCTRTDTMDGGMAWGRDEGTVASRQCCRRPRPCTRQYSPVANVLLRVVSCDADAQRASGPAFQRSAKDAGHHHPAGRVMQVRGGFGPSYRLDESVPILGPWASKMKACLMETLHLCFQSNDRVKS